MLLCVPLMRYANPIVQKLTFRLLFMKVMKDALNRYKSPNGKVKALTVEDLPKIVQCHRILRCRIMGMTWREISVLEREDVSTLYERYALYMGDLVAKCGFSDPSLLPMPYRDLRAAEPSSDAMRHIIDATERGVLLPDQEFEQYRSDIYKEEFKPLLLKKTGVSWDRAIRLDYMDEFCNLCKIADPTMDYVSRKSKYHQCDDFPMEWCDHDRMDAGLPPLEFRPSNLELEPFVNLHPPRDLVWKKIYKEQGLSVTPR